MIVEKVNLDNEEYLTDLEIFGSCDNHEAMELEKIAKTRAYFLMVFGNQFVDVEGYHGYQSMLADARVKYTPNNNKGENQLDFHLDYSGTRINWFWRSFQKKIWKNR